MYFIYLLTHTPSGKQYVGRSNCMEISLQQRINGMGLPNTQALRVKDFTFEIIEYAGNEVESRHLRIKYIHSLNTLTPNGFNYKVAKDPYVLYEENRKSIAPKLQLIKDPAQRELLLEKRDLIKRLYWQTKLDKSHWQHLSNQELKDELLRVIQQNKLKRKDKIKFKVVNPKKQKILKPWAKIYRSIKIRTNLIGNNLNYTPNELKAHLESKFSPDMSWDNYGKIWSIDHIEPIKSFTVRGIYDTTIINALSNIQPLLLSEHSTKNKYDRLYIKSLMPTV